MPPPYVRASPRAGGQPLRATRNTSRARSAFPRRRRLIKVCRGWAAGKRSGRGGRERYRLSRVAADTSLTAGESAAPQGSEPALFAVLEGRIEPVQRTEGVERVVGVRHPGEIFGEVPIVLGTVFPVGFRAAVPSRVMRIEPRDYHAIASTSPEIAREVGRLATHRMSGLRGLQGLAADP